MNPDLGVGVALDNERLGSVDYGCHVQNPSGRHQLAARSTAEPSSASRLDTRRRTAHGRRTASLVVSELLIGRVSNATNIQYAREANRH